MTAIAVALLAASPSVHVPVCAAALTSPWGKKERPRVPRLSDPAAVGRSVAGLLQAGRSLIVPRR